MGQGYSFLPRANVRIESETTQGALEWWRTALGHGGINAVPLPPRAAQCPPVGTRITRRPVPVRASRQTARSALQSAKSPCAAAQRTVGNRAVVALFDDLLTPEMAAAMRPLERSLTAAGFRVRRITGDALADPNRFNRKTADLLIYAAGKRYPAGAADVLQAYLKEGRRLIVLGGPAFSEPAWRIDGQWQTWETLRQGLAQSAWSIYWQYLLTRTVSSREDTLSENCDCNPWHLCDSEIELLRVAANTNDTSDAWLARVTPYTE